MLKLQRKCDEKNNVEATGMQAPLTHLPELHAMTVHQISIYTRAFKQPD
jgi:hypothetical protein